MFRTGSLLAFVLIAIQLGDAQLVPPAGPIEYAFSLSSASVATATVDSTGAVYFGGTTAAALPVTTGAFQSVFAPCPAVGDTPTQLGHSSCNWGFLGKLTPDGTLLWLTYLAEPNGNSSVDKIATDAQGNVFVTISYTLVTGAAAFPITPGTVNTAEATGSGIVAELNPSGGLVYATYLRDVQSVYAIAPDSLGNLYLSIFPYNGETPPLTHTIPGTDPQGSGYLVKLSAGGTSLLYATNVSVPGGDAKIQSLAVDTSDALYLAGGCGDACVPTSVGAYQSHVGGSGTGMFAMKLGADGTVAYSTLLSGTDDGQDAVNQIVPDAAGNLILTGQVEVMLTNPFTNPVTLNFPVTPNAFQAVSVKRGRAIDSAFIAKLDPTGSTLLYFSYFAGSASDAITGATLDAQGNVVFGGISESPDLPVTPDAWQPCHPAPNFTFVNGLGASFIGKLSADGQNLLYASFVGEAQLPPNGLPGSSYTLAGIDSAGNAVLFGGESRFAILLKYSLTGSPNGTVACVSNATHGYESAVSPVGMVRIRGNGISGGRTLQPTLSQSGALPTSYDGLQVYFDDDLASILEMSADEITAIVPGSVVQTGSVLIAVAQSGVVTGELGASLAPAAPGIITSDGLGFGVVAAINQDGSINSRKNPAAPGSVVTFYMTGLGSLGVPISYESGTIATEAVSVPSAPTVTVEAIPAEVLYAGSAPGLLLGVYQLNVRIPATTDEGLLPLGVTANGQMAQNQSGVFVRCAPGATCGVWSQQ